MASKYASLKTFGNETKEMLEDLITIDSLIETLKRNVPVTKKKKVLIPIEKVDFSSLKRKNNVLILDVKQKYKCVEYCEPTCLSDEQICRIYEEILSKCETCGCSC